MARPRAVKEPQVVLVQSPHGAVSWVAHENWYGSPVYRTCRVLAFGYKDGSVRWKP